MENQIQASNSATIRSFMNRHMTAIDIIASIVIAVLVMTNVFMYLSYSSAKEGLKIRQEKQALSVVNGKILTFTKLFIEKVLKAQGEIDFETRLKLESAVRELEDEKILASWQKFTSSATEKQAQDSVKDLLSVLVEKIQ